MTKDEPRRHAEMGRADGDRVGADPHETGVAEAHLSGEAHQQVQAGCREREHEHQRRDPVVVARGKQQRQQEDDRRHRRNARQPVLEDRTHGEAGPHTRSTDARPNRPRGMANSTISMTRNATASLYCEER